MDLVVLQYLYGGFDAWPINTEFLVDVEESCTFQKIYGLGNVKLKIKWPGRLEKTQI
jgi:hypothetical protein